MDKRMEDLLNACSVSDQPVLSAFINLKNEDHSYKKIRSLFKKAQNDLKNKNSSIDKLDEILANNQVSGNELGLDTGLSDVNVALFVTKDQVFAISSELEFNDQYCVNQYPFILPLIKTNLDGVKALVVMRKFTKLYSFARGELREVKADFPKVNEYDLENFDNQIVQDRSKKRRDAIMRSHVKKTLDLASRHCFAKDDEILIIAKEEFLNPVRNYMESSRWKKSHVVEKHNFREFNKTEVKSKIEEFVRKNKMNEFASNSDKKTWDYRSLNLIKQDIAAGNIAEFKIKRDIVENSSNDIPNYQDLNLFVISLVERGAKVSAYSNLENNFSVEAKNLDEGKFYSSTF